MYPLNELWVANVLRMDVNPRSSGIDLSDKRKDVEVKFTRQREGECIHKSWRVLGHELEFAKSGRPSFWALGFYFLNEEIKNIHVKTQLALEKKVVMREVFVLPWKWMYQYPTYHHVGQTRKSKWDHWLIFCKYKDFPRTTSTYSVKGGKVNLTWGVPTILFDNIDGVKI